MYRVLRWKRILPWNELIWPQMKTWGLFRQPIPRLWLVAEYLLDGNANDSSWAGNNWTGTSVSYTSSNMGYTNQCVVFTWTAYITSWFSGHNSGDFTDSFWFKYSGTGDQVLYGSNSGNRGWLRYWNPAWTIQISVNGSNVASVSDSVTTGVRYHYILTRSWNNYTLYKNNMSILTNTTSGVFSVSTLNLSWVFNNGTVPAIWSMKLWRSYNRVLTPKERQALYYEWLALLH